MTITMKNMLYIFENLKLTFEVLPNTNSVRFMDFVHIQDALLGKIQ